MSNHYCKWIMSNFMCESLGVPDTGIYLLKKCVLVKIKLSSSMKTKSLLCIFNNHLYFIVVLVQNLLLLMLDSIKEEFKFN